jgi:hypothetical protein
VSFSKTSNSTRPLDSCYFEVFEKLTRACYIQIALETMLLPIVNRIGFTVVTVAIAFFISLTGVGFLQYEVVHL